MWPSDVTTQGYRPREPGVPPRVDSAQVHKDPDILVDLTTAASAFEAEVVASALEAHGIPARAFAGAAHMAHHEVAASQPYRVQVRRRDLDRARTLLEEIRKEHAQIDWDTVDVGQMEEATETAPQGSVNPPGRPRPAAGLSGPRARSSVVGAPAPRPVEADWGVGRSGRTPWRIVAAVVLGLAAAAGIAAWIV